ELMSTRDKTLAVLEDERKRAYPCSGEINFTAHDSEAVLQQVEALYANQTPTIDRIDGLSMVFSDWGINLRASNTEPLLRLNIETRGNPELLQKKIEDIERVINIS